MGYDLHITRAAQWADNAGFEIPADEWLALVASDPELGRDPAHGPHSVRWTSPDLRADGWFDWYQGNVYTTDPSRAAVVKMLLLARTLSAMVQGDDNEVYATAREWRK